MKTRYLYFIIAIPLILSAVSTTEVHAQTNHAPNDSFGLGLMLGEPSGVSVKNWFSDTSALDIGAAWSLSDRNESLHLHSNFLLHNWFRESLAFYYGVGGRVIFADDPEAGVRVPFGLNYVFGNASFDLFVEVAPILNVTPGTSLAGNGGVGLRYYF